ncbi:hypothetical protein [Streptomyces sp. NPDC003006]
MAAEGHPRRPRLVPPVQPGSSHVRHTAHAPASSPAALTAALAPTAQAASPTITRAEYDKVKPGTSVSKMYSVAGRGACKLTSSSGGSGYSSKVYECKGRTTAAQMHSIAGKGVCVRLADAETAGAKSASYSCEQSRTYGSAVFTLTNGKVVSRAQYGLR